ncbi:acetyl-CoA acetyltransferase [uncultured Croceicoccus sp.]|uniref:acetyl-CoA acetyltransferase n=1 Tax=uncultured Croceicoccus sp. TaxID=1295329 RepID=UPI0026144D78|nr:acetyl-CoA acetyltransferase [uncultured Croceicoccus sp.]
MTDQPEFDPRQCPVIIGAGELADRPENLADALDPAGLMVAALRLAERDADCENLLARLDRLDIINEISWPYPDPEAELRRRLGQSELQTRYWPVGGQTPITALHEAALDIQAGRARIIAVCGGEAEDSVRRARKSQAALNWPERDEGFRPVRGGDYQGRVAKTLGLTSPVNVYPLYENASRAAWRQNFDTAQQESARIWSRNSHIAAARDAAWLKSAVDPETILSGDGGNRLIAWPYRKLMVANPIVNQGAAFIVTSLTMARELGICEDRMIFIHGGTAADEPRDILARQDYSFSRAMEGVLGQSAKLAGDKFAVELYSCFPCVPKMARRVLGLSDHDALSVTGGLTFFGAPLNNFMGHAVVAMVHHLRRQSGWGLLYGQGEYVTKHHAVMLGTKKPERALPQHYRMRDLEKDIERAAPRLDQSHRGLARLETYTVVFDRNEDVRQGIAIARAPDGSRVAARVEADDACTLEKLMSEVDLVGRQGEIGIGADELPHWCFI